jgi:GNAT superfamily N-acetyltransferase
LGVEVGYEDEVFHSVSPVDGSVLMVWVDLGLVAAVACRSTPAARSSNATVKWRGLRPVGSRHSPALRSDAPAKLVRGLPAYPVGMVLLARLAVDRSELGKGIGSMLLTKALRKPVAAGDVAAARLVVVDAVDQAGVGFYERYGFIVVPGHPLRLYRRLKDVRSSFESPSRR